MSNGNEAGQSNAITVTASFEYPVGTLYQATWAGQTSVTIPANQQAPLCDPIPVEVAQGASYWVRQCVQQSGSTKWPLNVSAYLNTSNGGLAGDSKGLYVNGASNASPIVITTATSHNFTTGQTAIITGANGNTAANGTWTVTVTDSTHFSLNGSTGNGAWTNNGTIIGSDLTMLGSMAAVGGTSLYGPVAVIAQPINGASPADVAIIGNSIARGSGDTTYTATSGTGWIERGLQVSGTFGFANLAVPGTSLNEFSPASPTSYFRIRAATARGRDYVFVELGTNDLLYSKVSTIQSQWIALWGLYGDAGQRVIQTTILPRTTSTDSWATAGNQSPTGYSITAATNVSPIAITIAGNHSLTTGQTVTVSGVGGNTNANGFWVVTVTGNSTLTLNGSTGNGVWTSGGLLQSGEANRVFSNTWLRDGAPIDSVSRLPLAAGAVSSSPGVPIRAGASGHPLWMVIDPCVSAEVNASNTLTQNGGRWITNGTASYSTADGIHPTSALDLILESTVPTASMVAY